MSKNEKSNTSSNTNESSKNKKKKKHIVRQISIDDIGIKFDTKKPKKKNNKNKQTASTPTPKSASRPSSTRNNKKKKKKKNNQLIASKANNGNGTKIKVTKPSNDTNDTNNSSKDKRAKFKKHGRQRSKSDLGLKTIQITNEMNQISSPKNKINTKSKEKKKQKTKDDTYLTTKKKKQNKRSSTLTPQPKSTSKSISKSISKSKTKTKTKTKRSSSTETRPKSISTTPKSIKNRSKSPKQSNKKIDINTNTKTKKETKQTKDAQIDSKKVNDAPTPIDVYIPPANFAMVEEEEEKAKMWPLAPVAVDSASPSSAISPTSPSTSSIPVSTTNKNEKNKVPSLSALDESLSEIKEEDKPIKIEGKPIKIEGRSKKKKKKQVKSTQNRKEFKKAQIRSKSTATKRKNKKPKKEEKNSKRESVTMKDINRKYGGIQTPKTPIKNKKWDTMIKNDNNKNSKNSKNRNSRRISKQGKRDSDLSHIKQEDAQQRLEYLKMQKMYREMKKDLNILKGEKKALEIEKRRIKKDQQKLHRDKEQFEVDTRTFHLKKDNQSVSKKYGVAEEDKLRKMLYAERKQWNEERKNLRSEILRLQGQLGILRHSDKQRMSVLKQDIMNGINMSMSNNKNNRNNNNNNNNNNIGPQQRQNYSRQQKELQRFIRIEKQKAMKDLDIERKKLAILARQLRADHDRLKSQRAIQRNKRTPTPTTPRDINPKVFVDKVVKKIYIQPKERKVYQRKGDRVNYRPKNTRIVYRDLRKKVVLRTHDWDTRIKYLNSKGKELNKIKTRIVTLEETIDKKKYNKRQNKKKMKGKPHKVFTKNKKEEEMKKRPKTRDRISSDSRAPNIAPRRKRKIGDAEYENSITNESSGDSAWDSSIDNNGSSEDEKQTMIEEKDTDEQEQEQEQEKEADPQLAKALEELDKLQTEYTSIEQDIDKTVEELHSEPPQFEEEKTNAFVDDEFTENIEFEKELRKLEKQMTIIDPEFEKQVSKMEHIVSEQAEEAGTLREVVESLSERLASAQLEIDNLKEKLRAAKRKQQLRNLYMKMAYSSLPEYENLKSKKKEQQQQQQQQQPPFNNKAMYIHNKMSTAIMSPKHGYEAKMNDGLKTIQIIDNDGIAVMDVDKAMNIICDPEHYSPSAIIKASKAIYANGLIDDRRDLMAGNNIVGALLDIIQFKGKLIETDPDALPVISTAIKALVPLLDAPKARLEFFKKDGIDILDDLFGPNIDNMDHIYPISSLIAEATTKVANFAKDGDKLKIDDIVVKLCHIAKGHLDDPQLLYEFGELLKKIDIENQENLIKPLIEEGILDITTKCALANPSDHGGVCDTFGLIHDHIADVESFLHNNPNVTIDALIDAIDLYAMEDSADVLTHVLDGIISMIATDPLGKELMKKFKDKGLEPVLMRAIDNIRNKSNNGNEEKYEEQGGDNEVTLKWGNNNNLNDNPIIESIADFYNSLEMEQLEPKMSQLKAKLNELEIPIYGTREWIDTQNPKYIRTKSGPTSDTEEKVLEDLYVESKYEFDESDAMQMVRDKRNKRMNHPELNDIGHFLSRIGKPRDDEYSDEQLGMIRKAMEDKKKKQENLDNNNQSKMSKLFSGMFKKKPKNKSDEYHESQTSIVQLKLDKFDSNDSRIRNDMLSPNRFQQQQRLFLSKLDKNGRKRIPKYDDFMNEAFNNKIGRGLNEVQQIYNEMTHHSGLVKPVGSMLQKWYVLANHSTTYWVSPSNKELSRYNDEHDDYYDMDDDEKYYDCWLLYDMKRKRMVQEIRWRNRAQMNDPKYITIQSARSEETPWVDVSNAYLEKTDNEQIISVNKKARYWRILFLGNHGEDTDEAPRFVFYEVQFWGRQHSTMQYSKATKQRQLRARYKNNNMLKINSNNREDSVSQSNTYSRPMSASMSSAMSSQYKKYKIGFGDNAKRGKKYHQSVQSKTSTISGIEMTGKSKFATIPQNDELY